MKLIADSGSTKTDWCVLDDSVVVRRLCSQGINPFQQDATTIDRIIQRELIACLPDGNSIDEIYFYGAGCRNEMRPVLKRIFEKYFSGAEKIEVCSDLVAAARALFSGREGIACILGTGSNSCLYDGRNIVSNVSPLGYVLGDEGSGAVLGRLFVNAIFKGRLSRGVRNRFLSETGLTLPEIIKKVYREPMANRFLASLSVYIHKYLDDSGVTELVIDNFCDFFRKNIALYERRDLHVGAVGSIAFYYEQQLREAARIEGFSIGCVCKSPLDGLVAFHSGAGQDF